MNKNENILIIGVAGGTGSGKTTDVVMEKDSEDDSSTVFRCEADVYL